MKCWTLIKMRKAKPDIGNQNRNMREEIKEYMIANPEYLNGGYAELAKMFGSNYEQVRGIARKIRKSRGVSDNVKSEFIEKGDTATATCKGQVKSLEELIKACNIDTSIWEVDSFQSKAWGVTSFKKGKQTGQNWGVTARFKRIKPTLNAEMLMESELISLLKDSKVQVVKSVNEDFNAGSAYVSLADLHIGAYIRNLLLTPDFDKAKIGEYLSTVADNINSKRYESVHVGVLGDLVESFTGLSHPNSWKGLEEGCYGGNAVIETYEILAEFFSKIINLDGIYIIAGNHDRVTSSNKEDTEGDVAKLVTYMLKAQYKGKVKVEFDKMCLTVVVDDICHILTHGHLGFGKKDAAKVIFEFGIQGKFNILWSAHLHSRSVKKPYLMSEGTFHDSSSFRCITCPSIFTGNFYSEGLGFTSTAGFIIVENNGLGKPNVFDYTL